ncbi:hypothetical protein F511_15737 [Dorcoceras hygrometricum]|uniref:Uncharacterized protein n=1 Tax=Dorcoceras hygrometricum TaxID=472368 RepID=A0A2Z7CIA0_9LAMI|nr:hypothetical protein F511_15737 [Dorcoceras hygrometricum]
MIRSEKPGSDTTVVDPDPPPGEAAKEQRINSRETINTKNQQQLSTYIGEPRLLCQPALEALTNSARTDSPSRIGRNEFRQLEGAAALGGGGGGL